MFLNIFLSLILLLSHPLVNAAEKIVTVTTLKHYAPFCMTEDDYQTNQIIPIGSDAVGFKGYSWDILRESFHQMGYTIHLSIVPWQRAINYLEKGKADILFPTGRNSEREQRYDFSSEFINQANFVVYLAAHNPLEWQGLHSLAGLTIGVKKGFNYGDKWRAANNIKKHDVLTILQGFKMLGRGRLHGFLGYEQNWDYILKQENWQSHYKKLPKFDFSQEYLAALKSNPKGKEILNAFDTGKKHLITSGRLQQIEQKWFGE